LKERIYVLSQQEVHSREGKIDTMADSNHHDTSNSTRRIPIVRGWFWDHLFEAVISSLIAGTGITIVEYLLTTPWRTLSLARLPIYALFYPFIGYATLFLVLDLLTFVVVFLTLALTKRTRVRDYSRLYRIVNVFLLIALLVVMHSLIEQSKVSLIVHLEIHYLVLILLAFLLVFWISNHLLVYLLPKWKVFRCLISTGIPLVVITAFAVLLFWDVVERDDTVGQFSREKMTPSSERDNIVLITLDTQRSDYIGCYGNETVMTPNIDRLAREGVLFSYCISQAPLTLPSHTSILTSTYPIYHGVRNNHNYRAGSSLVTLAEVLNEHGYRTGAFISSFVLENRFGLDQGFEVYNHNFNNLYVLNYRFFQNTALSDILYWLGFTEKMPIERRGDKTTREAIKWIRDVKNESFFLWLHYFDPHSDYDPPHPYNELYLHEIEADNGDEMVPLLGGRKQFPKKELEKHKALYKGEVTFTDFLIGLIMETLVDLDIREKTLVVITSDHGESFGEHGDIGHGKTLYNTLIQIPLIFNRPGRLPGGKVINGLCQSVDIMPTILDYLDIKGPVDMQGISLLFSMEGEAKLPVRAGFSETLGSPKQEQWLIGFVKDNWKYTVTPEDSLEELFNLAKDPGEVNNLVVEERERAIRMREELIEMLENQSAQDKVEPIELDSGAREALRALGYIQ
jgi:arylsulfatase A-like enzyme